MKLSEIEAHPTNPNFPKSYDGPKSVCVCGATGDGPNSEHMASDTGVPGHGGRPASGCKKFRWADWTPEYKEVLDELRSRRRS